MRRRTRYLVLLADFIIIVLLGIFILPGLLSNGYKGQAAILSSPSSSDRTQIENLVVAQQITVPAGTQVDVKLDQYTGSLARGSAVYKGDYPTGQFIVAKVDNNWKIVTYNKGDTLALPSRATAKQYSLPSGWFES